MNEELAKTRSTPHLSASSLRSYIDCSLNYRFSRIDKLKPEFISSALLLGSAVHRTLELCNTMYMDGCLLGADDAEEEFAKRLSLLTQESIAKEVWVKYKGKESPDSLLALGKSLVKLYVEDMETSVPENCTILAVEVPFAIDLPGVPVPVIGAMDLLLEDDTTGAITIVELKTAGKAYTSSDIDQTDQLTCYQLAVRQMGFHSREVELRIDTLVKTKTPKLERHFTARTELDEARVIRKLREAWRGVEAGLFIPNDGSWKCSGCGYRKACAEWSLENRLEAA